MYTYYIYIYTYYIYIYNIHIQVFWCSKTILHISFFSVLVALSLDSYTIYIYIYIYTYIYSHVQEEKKPNRRPHRDLTKNMAFFANCSKKRSLLFEFRTKVYVCCKKSHYFVHTKNGDTEIGRFCLVQERTTTTKQKSTRFVYKHKQQPPKQGSFVWCKTEPRPHNNHTQKLQRAGICNPPKFQCHTKWKKKIESKQIEKYFNSKKPQINKYFENYRRAHFHDHPAPGGTCYLLNEQQLQLIKNFIKHLVDTRTTSGKIIDATTETVCIIRWLRLVGSFKLQVSFAKEPYKRDCILQRQTYNFKEPTKRSHRMFFMSCNVVFEAV